MKQKAPDKFCYVCGKNVNNNYHSDYAKKPLCDSCGILFEQWKASIGCLNCFKGEDYS